MIAGDNVGDIQRTEESGEASPRHHRLQHIPTPLRSHSDLPPGLLPDSDHPPVCRQPHRLCPHQRHPRGRVEHVLLDPLHLHDTQRILEEDWDRCGPSWY